MPPTDGTAIVNGYDITEDISSVAAKVVVPKMDLSCIGLLPLKQSYEHAIRVWCMAWHKLENVPVFGDFSLSIKEVHVDGGHPHVIGTVVVEVTKIDMRHC